MDPELIRKVEAVLFASGRFMDASHLAELIEENKKKTVQALKALRTDYAEEGSALRILEEDDAWKIHVADEYLELVSKVVSDTEVSGPVLETLAIIAWRSPVLQSEVIEIRGTNAYEHVKELVERDFIKKEPAGRSYNLRVTEKFFEYFDVEGREDIKKVFKEVEEEHRKKEMELELSQKRLEQALNAVEAGGVAEVEMDPEDEVEAPVKTQSTLDPDRVSLDDLDEVLEKSRKKREQIAEEMKAMRPQEEEEPQEGESSGEDTEDVVVSEETDENYVEVEAPEAPPEIPVEEEPKEPTEEELEERVEELKGEPEAEESEVSLDDAKKIREKVEKDLEDI